MFTIITGIYIYYYHVAGCFSAPFLTKNDGIRLSRNQASECASVCRNSTYAGLKVDTYLLLYFYCHIDI